MAPCQLTCQVIDRSVHTTVILQCKLQTQRRSQAPEAALGPDCCLLAYDGPSQLVQPVVMSQRRHHIYYIVGHQLQAFQS